MASRWRVEQQSNSIPSVATRLSQKGSTGSSPDWMDAGTEGILEHRVATQCCKCDVSIGGIPGGRGIRQVRAVQRALHKLTQTLSKSQNQILHGSTEMELQQIQDSGLVEIKEIHKHPERIPAGERHDCMEPVANILTRTTATRRRWLRHMRAARLRFQTEGNRQALMTQYFQRSTTSGSLQK